MQIIVSLQQSIHLYAYCFQRNGFIIKVASVYSRVHAHATFWFLSPPATACFLNTVVHTVIQFLIKIYDHQSTTDLPFFGRFDHYVPSRW